MDRNYDAFVSFMAEMIEKYGEDALREIEAEELEKKVS